MRTPTPERGAAAVEFALVLPMLLLLMLGTMEFSRAFFEQATLASAAREAARTFSITSDIPTAVAAGIRGGSGVTLTDESFAFQPETGETICPAGGDAIVIVGHQFEFVTGIFPPLPMSAKAMFACQG